MERDVQFSCYDEKTFPAGRDVRAFVYRDYAIPPHDHSFYEINVIVGGSGIHRIENEKYPVSVGDVFVIPPGTLHAYENTGRLDVYHIIVRRQLIDGNRDESRSVRGYTTLMEIEPLLRNLGTGARFLHLSEERMRSLFSFDLPFLEEGGEYEDEVFLPLRRHVLWKILYQFSEWLYRQTYGEENTRPRHTRHDTEIMRALDYIHAHYAEKITAEDLCRLTYLSRSTLIRHFSLLCKCSPAVYLFRYRCARAEESLREGKLSKTEIAHGCGFFDLSHMERSLAQYRTDLQR